MKRLILAAAMALSSSAALADSSPDSPMTVERLRHANQYDLNDIYANAPAGVIPNGESNGTAVFFPGSIINTPTQLLAALVWQGKVFDTETGILVNKVFGFRAIKARLYMGESIFDGKESVIIDYKDTSVLAHRIRDEVRLVAPNLYLGRAYLRTWLGDYMVVNFILDFNHG
jgi:hypothetical protein